MLKGTTTRSPLWSVVTPRPASSTTPGRLPPARELVAEGAPDPGVGDISVEEMKIGAADRGPCHLQDDVVRMLDFGIGLAGNLDLVRSLVAQSAHAMFPPQVRGTARVRIDRPRRTGRAQRRTCGGRAGI